MFQAKQDEAEAAREASEAQKRAAAALAEAESAAQVAAWDMKSLREELEAAKNRYQEQSAELEESRVREASAKSCAEEGVRAELQGLRDAVTAAEDARRKAEDGLASAKDKKKRDLQVRHPLYFRDRDSGEGYGEGGGGGVETKDLGQRQYILYSYCSYRLNGAIFV